jgi:predicted dehydrogenase
MSDLPEIGIGMLGYAFMGKAHTNAYKKIPYMLENPPALPVLLGLAGRDPLQVEQAARRYGYQRAYTDWRDLLADERIRLFDNGAANNIHAAPCIAAAQAGKHLLCEKPLARNAEEAREMLIAAENAGVKHMTGFNYRFVPAIRLAYDLIREGRLGRLYHFRATYLHEGALPSNRRPFTWRMDREQAGSGALGDLGTHIIDLARFLVGNVASVSALTRTFVAERPHPVTGLAVKVSVDDAFAALVEFEGGAMGSLEATRSAAGSLNRQNIEINGEKGSLRFDLERLNELEVYWCDEEPRETRGWKRISVTERYHPWGEHWWPHGHILGWEHTFVHEIAHLLDCIVHDKNVAPFGATFADGYRASLIADAILRAAETRRQVDVREG